MARVGVAREEAVKAPVVWGQAGEAALGQVGSWATEEKAPVEVGRAEGAVEEAVVMALVEQVRVVVVARVMAIWVGVVKEATLAATLEVLLAHDDQVGKRAAAVVAVAGEEERMDLAAEVTEETEVVVMVRVELVTVEAEAGEREAAAGLAQLADSTVGAPVEG